MAASDVERNGRYSVNRRTQNQDWPDSSLGANHESHIQYVRFAATHLVSTDLTAIAEVDTGANVATSTADAQVARQRETRAVLFTSIVPSCTVAIRKERGDRMNRGVHQDSTRNRDGWNLDHPPSDNSAPHRVAIEVSPDRTAGAHDTTATDGLSSVPCPTVGIPSGGLTRTRQVSLNRLWASALVENETSRPLGISCTEIRREIKPIHSCQPHLSLIARQPENPASGELQSTINTINAINTINTYRRREHGT